MAFMKFIFVFKGTKSEGVKFFDLHCDPFRKLKTSELIKLDLDNPDSEPVLSVVPDDPSRTLLYF